MPSGSRSTVPDPSPSIDDWARPGRRVRAIAVALAMVIAVLVFLVVNRVWRGAAPPTTAPKAASVEVRLVDPGRPASPVGR